MYSYYSKNSLYHEFIEFSKIPNATNLWTFCKFHVTTNSSAVVADKLRRKNPIALAIRVKHGVDNFFFSPKLPNLMHLEQENFSCVDSWKIRSDVRTYKK